MDSNGEHHVARMDDTVTPGTLHARAEAVAVPDFNYLEQTVEAIAAGLTQGRRRGHAAAAAQATAEEERR